MNVYYLRRRYFTFATFGHWYDGQGQQLCATVERPWCNNQPNISCIPEGDYQLQRYTSPSKGDCLSLDAPELGVTLHGPSLRTACLVHAANRAEELEGCIAPGTEFGVVNGQWAVINSRKALTMLMAHVGTATHTLRILRD